MASTVTDIMTSAKAIAAVELGPEWRELPNVLNLAGNDARRGSKGYGVRPLSASSAEGVTNSYSLEHQFEMILMASVIRAGDDTEAMSVIGDLYDKQDEVYKAMARSKLNLPGTVLLVSEPALSEPELVSGKEFIALRQQFNVRYRQSI